MTSRRAAIYARISDDREGAGLGVERQEADCRALAEQLGWTVEAVLVDNDMSAYRRRKPRPAYQRMLDALKNGDVDAVLAWHNDRLHRSARELEDFIDVVEASGAAVQTARAGKYDLSTPTGRMTARIVGAVAQYESEHKSDRQLRKAQQLAEAGQVGNGGYRPFGYSKDRLTLVDDEADALRWAYAQVLAGRSLRGIAHELTEQGHLSTTGRPWTQQALRYNLLSGRNAALREHRRRIVGPAVWPAIVDRDTWERTRALLTAAGRYPVRADGTRHDGGRKYLLTGVLHCGRCGKPLRPARHAASQRFGCKPSKDGGCGGILITYAKTEEHVVALLLRRLERDADLTADRPADRTAALLEQIAAQEARLQALSAAFADDDDANPLELRAAGARIRRRIGDLRSELAQQAATTRLDDPLGVREAWPSYDLQQQRHVLLALVDRIDVGPARPGNRFEPSRLTVTWR